MRLVHDADAIESPPAIIEASISDEFRQLAAAIDRGEWGQAISAVILIENENGIHTVGLGEQATAYELIGVLECAKLRAVAIEMNGDGE